MLYSYEVNPVVRPCQASDVTRPDRVDHIRKYNWHASSDPLQRRHALARGRDDDIRVQPDQLFGVFAKALFVVSGPADVGADVVTFVPAELLQGLHQRGDAGLPFRRVRTKIHQHADPPRRGWLLRARRKRPRRRAADNRDELPPSHASPRKDHAGWQSSRGEHSTANAAASRPTGPESLGGPVSKV